MENLNTEINTGSNVAPVQVPAKAPKAKTAKETTLAVFANSGRDYSAMRRFIKKYGRSQVEVTMKRVAREEGDRRIPFAPTATITVLVTENPKLKGSKAAKRFGKYKTGMSIADAIKAGLRRDDFNNDSDKKFISIG